MSERLPDTGPEIETDDQVRSEALRALSTIGFPNKKTEAWRFTDVRALVAQEFEQSEPRVHHSPLPSGVTLLRTKASEPMRPSIHFAALNAALYSHVHEVHVAGQVDEPLVLTLEGENAAQHPRIRLVLEDNASLTLVERFTGHSHFTNQVLEIVVGAGARCQHVRVHEDTGRLIANVAVSQSRDSSYTSHVVSLGGELTRLDLHVSLDGPGAECNLRGAFHTRGTDHVDHHIRVEHIAPKATSHQEYRGLLDGKSTAVFDGQAIVTRTAPGSEAHQLSRNLLLSRSANVYTKPHLEIDHDDVIASHGATVGALDENEVFYLRSRGIPEREARALLTLAFVRAIVDALPVESLRDELQTVMETRLAMTQVDP